MWRICPLLAFQEYRKVIWLELDECAISSEVLDFHTEENAIEMCVPNFETISRNFEGLHELIVINAEKNCGNEWKVSEHASGGCSKCALRLLIEHEQSLESTQN